MKLPGPIPRRQWKIRNHVVALYTSFQFSGERSRFSLGLTPSFSTRFVASSCICVTILIKAFLLRLKNDVAESVLHALSVTTHGHHRMTTGACPLMPVGSHSWVIFRNHLEVADFIAFSGHLKVNVLR